MTVRYIRVNQPAVASFSPAVRAYGTIAMVGRITTQLKAAPADLLELNVPVAFTDPAEARRRAPGELGDAIALAFAQSPGPTLIYGVRVDATAPDWGVALDIIAALDVQLVALANTPLTAATGVVGGPIAKLSDHVIAVSAGGDGKERMGVAMLAKGSTDPSLRSALATERMVYIAHKSDQDAAAAVTGVIAGYQPHVSLLLKPVNISSASFTPAEIFALNGAETFDSPPAGRGVNWLTSPSLIPGGGVYMGEGYTGAPGLTKFIDGVRLRDSVQFQLKAQLIGMIGNVRISRSGLRTLIAQIEAILDPLVRSDILDDFDVVVPLLGLLDKDPATLTASELTQIHNAHTQRVVSVTVAVDINSQIHRLAMSFNVQ